MLAYLMLQDYSVKIKISCFTKETLRINQENKKTKSRIYDKSCVVFWWAYFLISCFLIFAALYSRFRLRVFLCSHFGHRKSYGGTFIPWYIALYVLDSCLRVYYNDCNLAICILILYLVRREKIRDVFI